MKIATNKILLCLALTLSLMACGGEDNGNTGSRGNSAPLRDAKFTLNDQALGSCELITSNPETNVCLEFRSSGSFQQSEFFALLEKEKALCGFFSEVFKDAPVTYTEAVKCNATKAVGQCRIPAETLKNIFRNEVNREMKREMSSENETYEETAFGEFLNSIFTQGDTVTYFYAPMTKEKAQEACGSNQGTFSTSAE